VEILINDEVFSSSINNFISFTEPPMISGSSPPVAPLGEDRVKIYIEGGYFDPAFEYFCFFKAQIAFQNETKAYFASNKMIICEVPSASLIRHSDYVNIKVIIRDL
jgi:hypothetical protein